VSSRAEEKERRRQERLAAEQAAQSSADRRKRLAFVGGGVLAVAVAVIVGLAVFSGGDDGRGDDAGPAPVGNVSVPPQRIENLTEAAEAAGCTFREHPSEGRGHTGDPVTYKTNPPTSGSHNPIAAEDGIYAPGNEPAKEALVHSLEHGRILFQYKPGTSPEQVAQLELVLNERLKGSEGYHTILFQNNTGMTPALAATAWTKSLTCPEWNDQVFDALRTFRKDFVDKAPEFIP
jgi:hypothetical protein